ncbi:MAG: VWA domain-containing protein [Treponema sp.]|jgi:Mg-chelatase subunit ChlD|nr:VWA domain-containing protein [Treponema sp.]
MKKSFILGLICLSITIGSAQQRIDDYIDEAVFKAARYLEERLPLGAKITIVNDTSKEVEEAVFYTLESNLVNRGKFVVLERNKKILQIINEELDFQHSGEVNDDTLAALGYKLGAQYIVLVSVQSQGGSIYRFRVKAVNVETAQIRASNEYRFQRQVAIQSQVMVDYRLNQLTYHTVSSSIGAGEVYLGLRFRVHSELNIEELTQDHIEAAVASDGNRKNICLVIDVSGSMSDSIDQGIRKIDWVKREMERYLRNALHEHDVISVIAFTDTFYEIIPSKSIKNDADREECINKIKELNPSGGTRIASGLRKGYELVKTHKKDEYINRVILFTDGLSDDRAEVEKIVAEHKNSDIATFSTVALCLDDASRDFMLKVVDLGGGFFLPVDATNVSRPRDTELAFLVTAATATLKNKTHRIDIRLSTHEGVSFKDPSIPSEGYTSGDHEFAYYRIDVKEDEYKTIWIKASLGSKAIQSGRLVDLAIASGTLLTRTHHILLNAPTDVTTYDKTRIVGVYKEL